MGDTLTSQGVTLDMGDMGSLAITNYNFGGIGTIQDMVPNGGEQPWDDLGTHGTPEQGVASPHSGNRLGYKTTMVVQQFQHQWIINKIVLLHH